MDGPLGETPSNQPGTKGLVYRNGVRPNIPATENSSTYRFNPVDGTSTASANNIGKAFFNNPMGNANCYGGSTSYMASNTLTHCGYSYNHYAASAGTGIYGSGAIAQATDSICPAGFRLPTALGTTVGDLTVLNASMAAGTLSEGDTTNSPETQAGWQPSGAWAGTFSGDYRNANYYQGTEGTYWASDAYGFRNAGWYVQFDPASVHITQIVGSMIYLLTIISGCLIIDRFILGG